MGDNQMPWRSGLPVSLTVSGTEYSIRPDYRVALDIFAALDDPELDNYNKAAETLEILFVDEIPLRDWKEALEAAFWFLRGGEPEQKKKGPQLVSWRQDFNLIASPVSKIIGRDIRGVKYLHWWSFLSAYMAIGDCLFAQVVHIRDLLARGKKMEKMDREFYRRNREIIDIKKPLTEAEKEFLKEWM